MIKHLDGILSPINRSYGFSVTEETDDFVHLMHNFTIAATFNQNTTAQEINDEADKLRLSE